MDYYCGIDIGAAQAKIVVTDETGAVRSRAVARSGVDYAGTADGLLAEALAQASIERDRLAGALATGYGRDNVAWAGGTMTEIACHGRGAHFHVPERITVIDIGAQDSKIIHLDADGRRLDFKLNRKCAAGTGAFLEEIALRLSIDISAMNGLAERSKHEIVLNSFCTVFAATEVLSLIRAGHDVGDIACAAFRSVVKRVMEMGRPEGRLVVTGGVAAHNPHLVKILGDEMNTAILTPPAPQFAGAHGAALLAREKQGKDD